MIAWQKKDYPACPACGGVRVDVPWSLPRRRERRFWGNVLLVLLAAIPAFAAAGLILGRAWPWIALTLAALGAGLLAVGYRRSQTIHLCLDCRKRWRPAK